MTDEDGKPIIVIEWIETRVRRATFDLTGLHRSMGWDASSIVTNHSPIEGYFGGRTLEKHVEIIDVRGGIPW